MSEAATLSSNAVGLDRRSREIGCCLVAANRVEDSTPAGALHEKPADHGDDGDDHHRQWRDAEQLTASDSQKGRVEGALRNRTVRENKASCDRASGARDQFQP